MMKRAMRCHDFGSGREASRSQYLEYWQGERQSPGPKLVPAPGLTLDIQIPVPGLRLKSVLTLSAGLAIYDICPAPSFASSPILARNARVFHHVRDS
jgi:hypothetical protein